MGVRRSMAGGTRAVLMLAMTLLLALGAGCSAGERIEGPVAAVMGAKGEVVLVDLEAGSVADVLRMRSWTGDIAADARTGTFVTAQWGGVGTDADDRLGIIDVRADRSVRYVKLPRPNPGGVESVGDGTVLVNHGWHEEKGEFSCVVDIAKRAVVHEGLVPDNNLPMRVIDGVGWSSGIGIATNQTSLHRVDPATLEARPALQGGPYARVECSTRSGNAGWLLNRGTETVLARFDRESGAVIETATAEFEDGPGRLVRAGQKLVALDYTGEDLERTGDRLLVFDADSLEQQRVIRLPHGPTDVAAWRDRVVVACWRRQVLLVVDPVRGKIERTVRLPRLTNLPLMVAVLDG